jgi:hypothetical protein
VGDLLRRGPERIDPEEIRPRNKNNTVISNK